MVIVLHIIHELPHHTSYVAYADIVLLLIVIQIICKEFQDKLFEVISNRVKINPQPNKVV